tara:strand:- start:1829 stop:2275 length:447 start_codon:yes stop_codon:yes gene_type:complete
MSWKPAAAALTLRKQVDKRWPKRDRGADGIIGNADHKTRPSDHNVNQRGYVDALDIDADLLGAGKGRAAAQRLADQIVAYAASGLPGSQRIKYVVYADQVASGSYANSMWTWRGSGYGHWDHIHISFTPYGETHGGLFPLPIFDTPKK